MARFSVEQRVPSTSVIGRFFGRSNWVSKGIVSDGVYKLEDTSSNLLGDVKVEGSKSSLVVDEHVEDAPYVSCDYGLMDQNLLAFHRTPEGEVAGVTVENYCLEGRMRIESRQTGDIYQIRRVA